jgi:hypothetical protein
MAALHGIAMHDLVGIVVSTIAGKYYFQITQQQCVLYNSVYAV